MTKPNLLLLAALVACAGLPTTLRAQPYEFPAGDVRKLDPRFCGSPARDASGEIIRSAAVLRAFRRIHPCPATGFSTGACPGWQINHTIPLACGGCDAIGNLDWMPVQMKTCKEWWCRDRWERRTYCRPAELIPSPVTPLNPPLKGDAHAKTQLPRNHGRLRDHREKEVV